MMELRFVIRRERFDCIEGPVISGAGNQITPSGLRENHVLQFRPSEHSTWVDVPVVDMMKPCHWNKFDENYYPECRAGRHSLGWERESVAGVGEIKVCVSCGRMIEFEGPEPGSDVLKCDGGDHA